MAKRDRAKLPTWVDMQKEEIAEWVKVTLKEAGISYAKASRALGLPPDAMSKVVRCERDLSATEMADIAKLADQKTPALVLATGLQPRYVRALGEVAAGLWRDVNAQEFEEFDFVALVDTRWPTGSVFGFVVRGESINKKAADGDRVVALLYDYAPRSLQNGDWVIVDRLRSDLRERTVKRAKWVDGMGWELWPHSDDSRYKEPLILGEHDGESVLVTAFVLDFVSTGTKF
jgi:hypothetical protein